MLIMVAGCMGEPTQTREFGNPNVQASAPRKLGNLNLFDRGGAQGGGTGIGVNAYLWRASLDTVSFMPLVSAESRGYVAPDPDETPPPLQREREGRHPSPPFGQGVRETLVAYTRYIRPPRPSKA